MGIYMSTSRYQNLMTILGVPEDNRFRLILSALHDLAIKNAKENNRNTLDVSDFAIINKGNMPVLFDNTLSTEQQTKVTKEIDDFTEDLKYIGETLDFRNVKTNYPSLASNDLEPK